VRAEPDLARLRLAVELSEQTPDRAFQEAGAAVARLREALRAHGVAASGISGSRLNLKSCYEGYGSDRRFLGYQCTASYVVETSTLDDLQQLIVDAVAAGANRVDEVSFDVHDKPAQRDEARRLAVAAARRKAEVYAEASGVRLGPVLHLTDLDPDQNARLYRNHGGQSPAGSDGDLAPGLVEVQARVLVGYSLVP
jgi:uncharacterized protein YggE